MPAFALPRFADVLERAPLNAIASTVAARAHHATIGVLAVTVAGGAAGTHLFGDADAAAPSAIAAIIEATPHDDDAEDHGDEAQSDPHDAAHHGAAPAREVADAPPAPVIVAEAVIGADGALLHAPLAGLSEPGPGGPLPVTAPDGRTPRALYARPYAWDGETPAIAVVVGGLGLSRSLTTAAIERLPPAVSLAFSPYTADLQGWIDVARAAGHEVLVEAPMEPFGYPRNDPGPHTLLADAETAETIRRLDWIMSRGAGYFAIAPREGGRFLARERAVAPVLATLQRRGVALLAVDAGAGADLAAAARRRGAAFAAADRRLDSNPNAEAIDRQLLALEAKALQDQTALGAADATPVLIGHLSTWARTLEMKGYALAPASAVAAVRAETGDAVTVAQESGPAAAPRFSTVQARYGAHAKDAAAADGDKEAKGDKDGGKKKDDGHH